MWEIRKGDKCKLMRPEKPQWEKSVGDKFETSVGSYGPRHPEWETSVGNKCKLKRPKAPKVGDKCGGQVKTV